MSKWRPNLKGNIYVIPDIHGRYEELKLILNRILPPRKIDGVKDIIIMLGDYVDRHANAHKVIDLLIECKKKYKDQFICLTGNHERMMLNGIVNLSESKLYRFWMDNGGVETLRGYLQRSGINLENPFTFPRSRINDVVPKEHIEFIGSLPAFYKLKTEYENFIFSHAGYNYETEDQELSVLIWGNGLYNKAKLAKNYNDSEVSWKDTIVVGHHGDGPFISNKFMMLDCSYNRMLAVFEINSMEAYAAKYDKRKLVKLNLGI